MHGLPALIAIFVAAALGALFLWSLWPDARRPVMLIAAMSLPSGLSLTSASYFATLLLFPRRIGWYPWLESFVLVVFVLAVWRRQVRMPLRLSWPSALLRPGNGAALACVVAAASACFATAAAVARANPWGYWDAFARINTKARVL